LRIIFNAPARYNSRVEFAEGKSKNRPLGAASWN
jgi:hypothetical protein